VSEPADWGFRFQQLAADAGQLYARSLRRYNELLDRVARGELQPDEVQKQFRAYLEERASTSTRELVELSVGLLAGLLHVEAKYRDGLLDGLLPSEGPAPPPPSPSNIDLTNWFQALATYAAEQSARTMSRHQQLVDRVASGEIPASRVEEQGRRFLEQHAPGFLADVMNLGLTFAGSLQRSSAALSDGLYDRVLGPDTGAPAQPEPPLCVDLRGPAGSTPSACIVVENARLQPAQVVCQTSEFTPRAGGERFRPDLEITPSRFTLAPGAQQDVTIRLPLDPAHFAAGADYAATVLISGAGEREIIVQLIARAEAPASVPSAG
jgi:hypothetical protein